MPTLDTLSRNRPFIRKRSFLALVIAGLLQNPLELGASRPETRLPLEEVLDRMQARLREVDDLQFDFTQRQKEGPVFKGHVYFKKPHQLRISQRAPQKQRVLSDGRTVWIYTPSYKQQLTGDWEAWTRQSGFPVLLLNFPEMFSEEQWKSHYQAIFGGHDEALYQLTFRPHEPGSSPVTLWVSDQTFLPVLGRIDSSVPGELSFREIQINAGLKADLFDPAVPADTTVVPLTF